MSIVAPLNETTVKRLTPAIVDNSNRRVNQSTRIALLTRPGFIEDLPRIGVAKP
jgi:hypothetical protein